MEGNIRKKVFTEKMFKKMKCLINEPNLILKIKHVA